MLSEEQKEYMKILGNNFADKESRDKLLRFIKYYLHNSGADDKPYNT